ncbi:aminotransferase class I/II-fold pyridoxal phosphate-dependent enzyme [Pseudooceanicola sp. CBS1P-1]|uniref:Aminotransferase n=1 Tax=Pseudooceanicola albus TaxID=2692189 RepID=A0A6L7FX24_9RHOB|nr:MULTISPECIES: aminotransferase class I/II-fold pyridoxal phosphate-dependent enzyme [Pseudooceanicola]MBT9383362.1 aminotransferase class I/II-fold pyridoxal phosphate-dependent enzyme [Pseudooceanicola endophyticus]MXN16315.1 aminotransferase class I/II-fold pyridoxal phosphate-dependent enzyme [Pseudooceanicola albus]
MQIGSRIPRIRAAGTDGWEIVYRARALVAAGETVLNLTIGEPDRSTDPRVLEAMHQAALGGLTGYTFGPGLPELRRAIAARVTARTGVATRPENVIVTPGGQAALFAAHMVLLSKGDTGLYVTPHYPTYPTTILATGAQAEAVAAHAADGFQPTAAAILRAQARTGARSLLINTPNNPTGVVYAPETVAGIAGACREADLWLISDEVYDTQVWEGHHQSPRALPGMAERTVVIGSMSKSHAMTGSRLGWLVAPEEVVEAATVLATNTTYGVVPYIQKGALAALDLGAAFEEEIAAPFRRRRALVQQVVAGSRSVSTAPAAGAMYVMLDIRATGLSGEDFARRLIEEERIAVMPGESFGAAAAGHLRIALTLPDDQLATALTRLVAFAEALVPA